MAGRQQTVVEDLIGFFVNTLAFRTNLSGDENFTDLLDSVKKTSLEAFEHQDVPFEKVVDVLGVERDMSRNPVFQVMFQLESLEAKNQLLLEGITAEPFPLDNTLTEKFDLTLGVQKSDQGLYLSISYRKDLYTQETMERMLGHFENAISSVLENKEVRISEIGLLTDPEENLLEKVFKQRNIIRSSKFNKTI